MNDLVKWLRRRAAVHGDELAGTLHAAADEIERLRAEVAENDGVIAVWRRRASNAEFELNCLEQVRLRDNQYLIDRAEKAERELAELRERIANAPVRDTYVEGEHGREIVWISDDGAMPAEYKGKRVRLLVEE